MTEVAALAGVSLKTVSRVVNGEPGVSPDLQDRVQAAVDRLDFRRNLGASNLRRSGSRTGVIGALLQDIGNTFSAGLLRAIEDAAGERGVAVLASSLDEHADREHSRVRDLVDRRVDGLVIMPASDDQSYLMSEVRARLPIVLVDRPPRGIDVDHVLVDNRAGAQDATRHLIAGGHRRIAVLTDLATISTSSERLQGYRDAMAEHGLAVDERLVVTELRRAESGAQASRGLMLEAEPPTAFFATRNVLATGVVRTLRSLGLSHSVAVVGFDDFPMADLIDPPMTVVRQDSAAIGAEVGRILFGRLDGDQSPPRRVIMPHTLVLRGSGEIAAP